MQAASPFRCPLAQRLYSTNIHAGPEGDTGIGDYSDADFLDAVQRGVRRDGARLYPAMPYPSYTYMTDEDALAIKAYLFSLPAVHAANRADALSFPFNQRWAMSPWSLFFNENVRFQPNTARSPEWNRGAYLAEALAHCGDCHTPRNLALALDNRSKFAGAVAAGWHAFNITSDRGTGIGAWSDTRRSLIICRPSPCVRPRHSGRPDGRGCRSEFQPANAGRHQGRRGLSCCAAFRKVRRRGRRRSRRPRRHRPSRAVKPPTVSVSACSRVRA